MSYKQCRKEVVKKHSGVLRVGGAVRYRLLRNVGNGVRRKPHDNQHLD
jgi:hypothetical protein